MFQLMNGNFILERSVPTDEWRLAPCSNDGSSEIWICGDFQNMDWPICKNIGNVVVWVQTMIMQQKRPPLAAVAPGVCFFFGLKTDSNKYENGPNHVFGIAATLAFQ